MILNSYSEFLTSELYLLCYFKILFDLSFVLSFDGSFGQYWLSLDKKYHPKRVELEGLNNW